MYKRQIYYNHNKYTLRSLPVIKLSGKMYLPAEETLSSIMGLTYSYNQQTKELQVSNSDVDMSFRAVLDSRQAILHGKNVTLTAPPKMIYSHKTKKNILCIPAYSVLGQLNYTKSWDKSLLCYRIQSKQFFNWSTKQASKQSTVQQTNTTTNLSLIHIFSKITGIKYHKIPESFFQTLYSDGFRIFLIGLPLHQNETPKIQENEHLNQSLPFRHQVLSTIQ